jgi:hypothetical protein
LIPGVLVAWLLAGTPARAASITFDSQTVNPKDFFTVAIDITDVVDLYTFGLDVSFDSSVVNFLSVTRGDVFTNVAGECDVCFFAGFPPDDPLGSPGVVSFILDSLVGPVPGVSSAGTLAFLTFQAVAGGNANISVFNVLLADSVGGTLDPTITNGLIMVNAPQPVPEPSTLALLGIGLAAMARKRLKRQTLG